MAGTARITVDLAAVTANYAQLRQLAATSEVAAVVKANAYGLGVAPVAANLVRAGCRTFFVETPAEGIELRSLQSTPRIFVLGGLKLESLSDYARHDLLPMLNTLAEVDAWLQQMGRAPAGLHIDTGMTRTGLGAEDVERLRTEAGRHAALQLVLVMSHLACADEPEHMMNLAQLTRFENLRRAWPDVPWSLANSAGIFLGARFHGDLVRPGIALYGGRPQLNGANPMTEVVRLEGRVVQIRTVREPASVGYGATQRVLPPARLATVGVGYADGYPRSLSGRGYLCRAGARAPLIGRVSMDLVTVDVSAPAFDTLATGDYLELIGGGAPLEEVAALAGTLNYELLTSLSRRAERIYV
jgi:alanine racemase